MAFVHLAVLVGLVAAGGYVFIRNIGRRLDA